MITLYRVTTAALVLSLGAVVAIDVADAQRRPPRPGRVVSSGRITLPQTYQVDFDTGAITQSGADLWFHAENWQRMWIEPVGGATQSPARNTAYGRAGCNAVTIWSPMHRPISPALTGMHFCMKTNAGNMTEYVVERVIPGNERARRPGQLIISYTTWG